MINEYVKLIGEIEMRYEIETGDQNPMESDKWIGALGIG